MIRELKYPIWYHANLYKVFSEKIKHRQSFILTGIAGSGASTALRVYAQNPIFINKYIPRLKPCVVFIDINGLGEKNDLNFYRQVYAELNRVLKLKPKHDLTLTDRFIYVNSIGTLLKKVCEAGGTWILICDKFDALADAIGSVLDQVRAWRESGKDNFIFIPSMGRFEAKLSALDLQQLNYLCGSDIVYMVPLSDQEMLRTLDLYQEFHSVHLNPAQRQLIVKYASGNPGLSIALMRLFDSLEPDQSLDDDYLMKQKRVVSQLETMKNSLLARELKVMKEIVNDHKILQNDEVVEHLKRLYLIDEYGLIKIRLLAKYLKSEPVIKPKSDRNLTLKGGIYYQGSEALSLSKFEFTVLGLLFSNRGVVVTRDEIAQVLAPKTAGEGVSNEAIDQLLSRIRRKLGSKSRIKTIFGRGYMFE